MRYASWILGIEQWASVFVKEKRKHSRIISVMIYGAHFLNGRQFLKGPSSLSAMTQQDTPQSALSHLDVPVGMVSLVLDDLHCMHRTFSVSSVFPCRNYRGRNDTVLALVRFAHQPGGKLEDARGRVLIAVRRLGSQFTSKFSNSAVLSNKHKDHPQHTTSFTCADSCNIKLSRSVDAEYPDTVRVPCS